MSPMDCRTCVGLLTHGCTTRLMLRSLKKERKEPLLGNSGESEMTNQEDLLFLIISGEGKAGNNTNRLLNPSPLTTDSNSPHGECAEVTSNNRSDALRSSFYRQARKACGNGLVLDYQVVNCEERNILILSAGLEPKMSQFAL